jgi:hypothetical protein
MILLIHLPRSAFLFTETGTEGGYWAVQEDGFLSEDEVSWKYEGLRLLEEGDDLTVLAKDVSVFWHGIFHKDEKTGMRCHRVLRGGKWVVDRSWEQQVVGGFWVHWVQAGMDTAFGRAASAAPAAGPRCVQTTISA